MNFRQKILTGLLLIFAVSICIGIGFMINEGIRQQNNYDDCRDIQSTTAVIMNVATYTLNCNNCRQLNIKYHTYKIGEVITYLVVQCMGTICSTNYVIGNNVVIYYNNNSPGTAYLTKPECHYNIGTLIFYLALGLTILGLIGVIMIIIFINTINTTNTTNTTNTAKKKQVIHTVPTFSDKVVYFEDDDD